MKCVKIRCNQLGYIKQNAIYRNESTLSTTWLQLFFFGVIKAVYQCLERYSGKFAPHGLPDIVKRRIEHGVYVASNGAARLWIFMKVKDGFIRLDGKEDIEQSDLAGKTVQESTAGAWSHFDERAFLQHTKNLPDYHWIGFDTSCKELRSDFLLARKGVNGEQYVCGNGKT